MVEGSITVLAKRRGHVYGPDGLYYPCEEDRAVPLSGAAIRLILYLYAAVRHLVYPRREDVYVAADQFIYYVPQTISRKVAPDLWVCYGVPKEPERDVFRIWEEGATPSFVAEVSSNASRAEDRGPKFALYQDVLRCREYLIYDEDSDELLLYRRAGEALQPVSETEDGRFYSEELDLWFGKEPGQLVRVYGPDGQPVANLAEAYDIAAVEVRLRQHFQQEAEAQARRAEELETEVERLRAEVEHLRGGPLPPAG